MYENLENIGCFHWAGGPESFVIYPVGGGIELILNVGYENLDNEPGGHVAVSGPVRLDGLGPYQSKSGSMNLGFMTNGEFAGLVKALRPKKRFEIESQQKQIEEGRELRYSEPL